MNEAWSRIEWGWVKLFPEDDGVRIVHGAYPNAFSDPSNERLARRRRRGHGRRLWPVDAGPGQPGLHGSQGSGPHRPAGVPARGLDGFRRDGSVDSQAIALGRRSGSKTPGVARPSGVLLLALPQSACAMKDQRIGARSRPPMSPPTAGWSTPATGGSATARARATACCWPRRTATAPPSTGCGAGPASHLMRDDVRLFRWRYDPEGRGGRRSQQRHRRRHLHRLGPAARLQALEGAELRHDSRAIRAAIARNLVADIGGRRVLLPGLDGFRQKDAVVYNPSYFVLPALRDFAAADPAGPWGRLIQDGLTVARDARFGQQSLPADWVRIDASGVVTPDPAIRRASASTPFAPRSTWSGAAPATRRRRPPPPASGDDTRGRAGRRPPGSTSNRRRGGVPPVAGRAGGGAPGRRPAGALLRRPRASRRMRPPGAAPGCDRRSRPAMSGLSLPKLKPQSPLAKEAEFLSARTGSTP
jgi:hypothetical protein